MRSRWLGVSSFAAAGALALVLSGCGGSGGTGSTGDSNGESEMSILDNWKRFEAGTPTLQLSSTQIEQAYESRNRAATHDLYWSSQPFVCAPRSGDCGEPPYGVEVEQHENEEFQVPRGSTVAFAPVLEHNGVRISEMKARVIYEDEDDGETYLTDIVTYGGWLDHTVFGVGFFAECAVDEPGCSGTAPVYAWGGANSLTPFGVYPGTTPTGMGSATWAGVMVGMEAPKLESEAAALAWVKEGQPDVYLGDALIMIEDLAAPDVDVSFTNIHNVTEGTPRDDMIWEGLSVENGLFGDGDSDEYVAGMFTGSRHQEVGGEFQKDGIAGGFGAKRR